MPSFNSPSSSKQPALNSVVPMPLPVLPQQLSIASDVADGALARKLGGKSPPRKSNSRQGSLQPGTMSDKQRIARSLSRSMGMIDMDTTAKRASRPARMQSIRNMQDRPLGLSRTSTRNV